MDAMLDLETLSTSPSPVILTVGLCAFDPEGTGLAGPSLELQINPDDGIKAGLDVDWSTVYFWMTQSDEAQAGLPRPGLGLSLPMALQLVSNWFRSNNITHVWSNGASADVPWLESSFRAVGMKVPWGYSKVLDVRTLKWITCGNVEKREPEVAHNCLSDAQAQALWVQDMMRVINGKRMAAPWEEEREPPKAEAGGMAPADSTVDAPPADVNDRPMSANTISTVSVADDLRLVPRQSPPW
ncbi:endodeoxyribonuclease protein [Rhizobium phage RHph_I72]|nr:endodeoxyribonuclease protein [Rhizobium phage RHph_I72]